MAPTACRRTVSGTISLSCSEYFSPFPYGTGSLSVTKEYLALPDGAGWFTQDSSGPALLRILLTRNKVQLQGYHLLWPNFPEGSSYCYSLNAVLQPHKSTPLWFGLFPVRSPLLGESLVIFFSYRYLDVSVPCVSFLSDDMSSTCRVVPFGYLRIDACMQLPEAFRSLPRPSSPLSA